MTRETATLAADLWNAQHAVGTPVHYWPMTVQEEPRTGRTRSTAQVLGGHTAVVWVEGCAGAISLSHVEALPQAGDPRDTEQARAICRPLPLPASRL